MNEKINITKMDGATVTADIIAFIENTTSGKRYVYYTLNEIVGAGPSSTVKIYVSKLKQDNPTLDAPITDDDWHMLKDIMSDSIKGTVTATIKYLPLSDLGTPVSVSDRAIAMPTSYDYINKQRGLYAQGIATTEPAPAEPTPAPTESSAETTEPAVSQPMEPVAPAPETQAVAPTVEPVQEAIQPSAQPPIEPAPVAPTPEPVPAEPINPEPAPLAPEPTPMPEQPPVVNDIPVPTPVETSTPTEEDASTSGTAAVLEPIDLATIEAKYAEMIDEINKLKEKELEAAKRYNATIELNNMHTEQHANYVQNDIKENIQVTESPAVEQTSAPTPVTPVTQAVEPTPVTPVVPAPSVAPTATPADIETNWFDMPNN